MAAAWTAVADGADVAGAPEVVGTPVDGVMVDGGGGTEVIGVVVADDIAPGNLDTRLLEL
jgi:hypothetical protein